MSETWGGSAYGPSLDRRKVLTFGSLAASVAVPAFDPAASAAMDAPLPVTVPLTEGTNLAVALSPDGASLAFDLLGLLWVVPAEGGAARCLTDAFADLCQPSWSPDGKRIVFQSYRTGNFQLWMINADGSGLRRLTDGFADHREPSFSPDGGSILFSSDVSGHYAIHLLDLGSGQIRLLTPGDGEHSEPCFARDGQSIAYVLNGTKLMVARMDAPDRPTMVASTEPSGDFMQPSELHAPSFSPDGKLAYHLIHDCAANLVVDGKVRITGEDIYPFKITWAPNGDLIYAATGKIRRLTNNGARIIPFRAAASVATPAYPRRKRDFTSTSPRPVVGIGSPMLSPDGRQIVFRALNGIYILTIGDPHPRLAIGGPFYKCDPAWAPDGKALLYSTDKGGTLDLWLHDLASGAERQLTNLPCHAALSGNWSRDGRWIVFLNQDGALHILEVATGAIRQIYDNLWEPGRPSFSPDARMVTCAAFKPCSARYREGLSEVLMVERATGRGRYHPIAENKSIATRGDDGPVWSPDGKHLAYVFASQLWVQPVDDGGRFVGSARRIVEETTDAPSWSGDGQTLLYLNNGALKLVSLEGGPAREVPFGMTWALAKPAQRSLITGARLWDGSGPHYRPADVLIEGNRIAAVAPPGSITSGTAAAIDGQGLTLLPGLIDMHTHRQMQGYGYGDRMGRLWLSMGITATRSPGCPAYHMVEDREAIDSGHRTAPRHFATGEAIDGGRIFYNFMRPVTEVGQLARELARAEALSYDLIKTYVRLDHRTQAEVVRAAHRMGVGVTSHYHYPALRNAADGMEHIGATSRFGYSRTVTAAGAGYEDVTKLFAVAKAGRTPAMFAADVLLADDRSFLDDRRIQALFPPWEYARLAARYAKLAALDRAPLLSQLERNVRQIKDTMARGWHVHSGTDAPIEMVAISLHLNLRAMTRFGVSPHDALLSATRHAGDFLQEPIGVVAAGKLADLILVEGDPLSRIEDLTRVRATIANGLLYDTPHLIAPFEGRSSAIPPSPIRTALTGVEPFFWQDPAYVEVGRHACCAGHLAIV